MQNKILFPLMLALVVLLAYSNSLHNDFVLDDEALIVKNPIIKSAKLFPLIFKTSLYDYPPIAGKINSFNRMYRPVQILTYRFDYLIWGLRPNGYRLTNILIHALNCILVYFIFAKFFNENLARFTSIIFAVHPIHGSAVAYISGRADLLAALFMLLAIIYFTKRNYVLSWLSGIVALFCRENALILFLFIALVICAVKGKPRDYFLTVPFILLDLMYLSLRFAIFGSSGVLIHPDVFSFWMQVVNFLNIALRYLSLLLIPLNLHMVRTTAFILRPNDIKVAISLILVAYLFYWVIKKRENKAIPLGMLWFFIGIIPVFFFLHGYFGLKRAMMAESWLYFASIGFFSVLAAFGSKRTGKVMLSGLCLFYFSQTVLNNNLWKNNIAVYKNTLRFSSEPNYILKNLILEYFKAGLTKEALPEVEKFAGYFPEASDRYILEGDSYYYTGKIENAIDSYNTALIINKYNYIALYSLSLCYEKLNLLDQSLEFALKSLEANPYYLDSLNFAADLYFKKKQFKEAALLYKRILEIDPDNAAALRGSKNVK